MRTFTAEEVNRIRRATVNGKLERDEHNQLIVYSGIFEWDDGTYRDQPQPDNNTEQSK